MLVAEVRNERIPCILPQVVFISCSIFLASVDEEDKGVPGLAAMGFLMGDSGRDIGLRGRCRIRGSSNGGEGMIEGKPIDEFSSPSWRLGGFSEPTRCRPFVIVDVGDLSLKRSSRVRVLGLEVLDSLLPFLEWLGT